jgi:hypothetical protein
MAKGNNQKKESKGKPKKDAKAKTDTSTTSSAGLMTRGSTEPIGKKK